MSDTWAAVLAISVAVMAVVQLVYLVGFAIAAKKLMTIATTTQQQVEALAADVKIRVGAVSDRVNAVADDVRAVTSRVQQVASSVSDGVHRVEEQVRAAGSRVQQTVDQVPPGVRKGVPAGLAILAALKTVQQVRQRMKRDDRGAHDVYAAS
ncbi:MAG TPA: hypothetical protein VMO26_01855 [Vicinamibacterales bacterium]|nr:hypothetical protein [Vicinamibacterales bacterium]